MSVSFIRIDDRMIHGQTCTRWAREYPCDGLIAVNDKAAKSDVLKAAYKAASGKKTFVWTLEHFQKKMQQVLDSDTRYFLIAKERSICYVSNSFFHQLCASAGRTAQCRLSPATRYGLPRAIRKSPGRVSIRSTCIVRLSIFSLRSS